MKVTFAYEDGQYISFTYDGDKVTHNVNGYAIEVDPDLIDPGSKLAVLRYYGEILHLALNKVKSEVLS